jgi:hypothetical protein
MYPLIHSFIRLYDLVVGVGLGQVLLQEGQVLVSGLGAVGGRGSLGGGGGSERGLLGVELGELGSEVGRESRSLRGGRSLVASDSASSIGGLLSANPSYSV